MKDKQQVLPKSVIEAISSCLVDMATPIIGQERPLLVSYDSIKLRMPHKAWDAFCYGKTGNEIEDMISATYGNDWVVNMLAGWGYSFTPRVKGF
jgi:hypothetical protein